MAADDSPEAVDGTVRIRRARTTVWPEKGLLAKAFEEDTQVRNLFRQNKGHLLSWPSPELVGVASLKALALNVTVVKLALRIWGLSTPTPKAMSVDWLKKEATCLYRTKPPNGHRKNANPENTKS